jgi:hypothetical protein
MYKHITGNEKKLAQAPNVKAQIPGTKKWSHDEKIHKT